MFKGGAELVPEGKIMRIAFGRAIQFLDESWYSTERIDTMPSYQSGMVLILNAKTNLQRIRAKMRSGSYMYVVIKTIKDGVITDESTTPLTGSYQSINFSSYLGNGDYLIIQTYGDTGSEDSYTIT